MRAENLSSSVASIIVSNASMAASGRVGRGSFAKASVSPPETTASRYAFNNVSASLAYCVAWLRASCRRDRVAASRRLRRPSSRTLSDRSCFQKRTAVTLAAIIAPVPEISVCHWSSQLIKQLRSRQTAHTPSVVQDCANAVPSPCRANGGSTSSLPQSQRRPDSNLEDRQSRPRQRPYSRFNHRSVSMLPHHWARKSALMASGS